LGFCLNLKQGSVSNLERYLRIGGRVNNFKFLRTKVEKVYLSSEYSRENHSGEMEKKEEWG
jgi:hypothetical protein